MNIFIRTRFSLIATCALIFITVSSGWDVKRDFSLFANKNDKTQTTSEANEAYRFFGDNLLLGDYTYIYDKIYSKISIDDKVFKNGAASLRFDFDPDTFCGGAICLYKRVIDLRPHLKKGGVQFWVKGAAGGEVAQVSLIDDDSDKKKTVVRVDAGLYGDIQKEWSLMRIPLKDFAIATPCYWDSLKHRELPNDFNWSRVAEFRLETRSRENKSFRVWLDDIVIVKKMK
jgi:hypothetical protein